MNHIAEKYSYTREKSSIGVFVAALVGVGPTMMLSKSIVLTAWRQGIISSIVTCHPRSSRRTTGYYTDFRRLSNVAQRKLHPLYSRESQNRQRGGSNSWMLIRHYRFSGPALSTTQTRWHIMNIHSISCIQWIFLVLGEVIETPYPDYKSGILNRWINPAYKWALWGLNPYEIISHDP